VTVTQPSRRLMAALGLALETMGTPSLQSTAADYTPMVRETEEQRRERLALEAGHTRATCPECGGRATRETVLVARRGEVPVRRTLLRCWRQPKFAHERCPVQTLSEEPVSGVDPFSALEEMLAKPAGEEETMSERTRPCLGCGEMIEDSHGRLRCPECNRKVNRERKRLAWRRNNAERKGLPVPEGAERLRDGRGGRPAQPKPAPAPAPVARAVVRPEVNIVVQVQAERDFGGLVREVLGLSAERRDLLRRLLAEVTA
jgi:predicted RNA-binding Zn-ribbon protein involved in translation (DUF1610 family)